MVEIKTKEGMSLVKQWRVSSVVTTLCVIALCLGALISPGMSTTEVKMNDGGVWVTNSKLRLVAHLNYPSRSLDSGLRADSDTFDVMQNGEEVFVNDVATASLAQVDVAYTALNDPADFDGYATTVNGERLPSLMHLRGKCGYFLQHRIQAFMRTNTSRRWKTFPVPSSPSGWMVRST